MKFTLEEAMKAQGEGVQIYLYSFFNLNARWCGWSMPHTSYFTSGHKTWYPLYRGWVGPRAGLDEWGKSCPSQNVQSLLTAIFT
jgi:hypothetical protein